MHGAVVRAANGLVGAGAVAGLLERRLAVLNGGGGGDGDGEGGFVRLTWCISTVTVSPALTPHRPDTPVAPLTLQRMLVAVTSVRGLFEAGVRTQVVPCWECQLHCSFDRKQDHLSDRRR